MSPKLNWPALRQGCQLLVSALAITTLAACSGSDQRFSGVDTNPQQHADAGTTDGAGTPGDNAGSIDAPVITPTPNDSVAADLSVCDPTVNQPFAAALTGERHINFESGPVRPLAISPNRKTLARVNIPNGTVELLSIDSSGMLGHRAQVRVGIDPVALAFRNNNELWVANHLSDSVSVVRVGCQPRVVETLLVGDEPRDIVFAQDKAFVTTAHRGQRLTDNALARVPGAGDPQLTTPGIGRADVWVFDAANTGGVNGGIPKKIVNLFGDTPRPLAVSADGNKVYAGIHFSGNQTSLVASNVFFSTECGGKPLFFGYAEQSEYLDWGEQSVPCDGNGPYPNITMPRGLANGMLPGKLPPPSTNAFGEPAPPVSLIVKYDNSDGIWKDVMGRNWNNAMRFNLPDYDVFEIDATSLNVGRQFSHAGTILFNMATNPVNGKVYVSNTDANNHTRFEGPGIFGKSTVQGKIALSQITVIDPATGLVNPVHLNSHIDYEKRPAPAGIKDHSLATPLDMVISPDGRNLYVAAFGSGKVGVIPTANLESGTINPTALSPGYINVTGGGPSGLVLNNDTNTLYVATRFDNGLSVVDLDDNREVQHLNFATPESTKVIDGRFMLYDAMTTSSNGEASCASCHVFGDVDHLAWDLGNPDERNTRNPQPKNLQALANAACTTQFASFNSGSSTQSDLCEMTNQRLNGDGDLQVLSSMKGPMTTQTLKGMHNHGNTHWRADRAIGYFYEDDNQTLNAEASFKNFIVAYPGLLGMDITLPERSTEPGKSASARRLEGDVGLLTDFMFETYLPPNPIRRLDNGLTPNQAFGKEYFFGDVVAGIDIPFLQDTVDGGLGFNCNGCHEINPAKGFYGSNGRSSFTIGGQTFKIPHQRNVYTKIGMFGSPSGIGAIESIWKDNMGDQIRGFAGGHDGAATDVVRLLSVHDFDQLRSLARDNGDDPTAVMYALQDFVYASETDVAPILGQQITLNSNSSTSADTRRRFNFLKQRAQTGFVSKEMGSNVKECLLSGSGTLDGESVEVVYNADADRFVDASNNVITIPSSMNDKDALTFTCYPHAR